MTRFCATTIRYGVLPAAIAGHECAAYLPNAPIHLGLALIGCGVLALVIAIRQYRWAVHCLWGEPFAPIAGMAKEPVNSPVLAIGVLLICIGPFAFFAVLLRLP